MALEKLMAAGADGATVSAGASQVREFNVDTGMFTLLRTTFSHSLSLTILKNHRKGSISLNDVSEEAINEAVKDCILAAEASDVDEAWAISDIPQDRSFQEGDLSPDLEKLFFRSKELLETIGKDYPKVMLEQMVVSHHRGDSVYLNSNNIRFQSESGNYGVSLMFSGHEGEKSSSFNGGGIITDDLDTPLIELGSFRQCLSDAEKQIDPIPCEGKETGVVVFTPDCLSEVIGSLLGNFVSDSVILDGTSPWKDKLGEKVVDQRLTISAKPYDKRIIGGQKYTGEGFVTEDFDIIQDGRLNAFVLSLYVANKTGKKRAPNGGGSLVIKNGETALKDLIGNIKKGLLVSRFSGGHPSANGDFSGVAKNSFMIENGEVTHAVSETMISGNLCTMLNDLRGISKEVVEDGASVLPWLAVEGIVISGK